VYFLLGLTMVGLGDGTSGYWYWQSDDQLRGPLSATEFDRLSRSGSIKSGDLVWHNSWAGWRPYGCNVARPPPVPRDFARVPAAFSGCTSRLLDEHLDSIGVPQHGKNQYQYVTVLNELLTSARDCKNSRFSSAELVEEEAFYAAISLMHDLVIACSRRRRDPIAGVANPERYKCIWRHRDLRKAFAEGVDSIEACPSPDVFTQVTERYLGQELHSATFGWILVDAIVASEIYWLGEEVKRDPSEFSGSFALDPFGREMDEISDYNAVKGDANRLFWVRFRRRLAGGLLIFLYFAALPIGVAVWADVNDLDEFRNVAVTIVGAAVAFALFNLGRWIWTFIRVLMGGKREGGTTGAIVLWRKMLSAYDELEGGTVTNPRRIRKVLARIVREGAGWNANVFPLLDKIIERSAGRWS
jgi:hypothetical protein